MSPNILTYSGEWLFLVLVLLVVGVFFFFFPLSFSFEGWEGRCAVYNMFVFVPFAAVAGVKIIP